MISDYYQRYYTYTIDSSTLTKIAQQQADATLVADDVPQVARASRDRFNEQMKGHYGATNKQEQIATTIPDTYIQPINTLEDLNIFQNWWAAKIPEYGSHPKVQTIVQDAKMVGEKVFPWLAKFDPGGYEAVMRIKKRMGSRIAIDYVAGAISLPNTSLHPLFKKYITPYVIAQASGISFAERRYTLANSASRILGFTKETFEQQPVYKRLFAW